MTPEAELGKRIDRLERIVEDLTRACKEHLAATLGLKQHMEVLVAQQSYLQGVVTGLLPQPVGAGRQQMQGDLFLPGHRVRLYDWDDRSTFLKAGVLQVAMDGTRLHVKTEAGTKLDLEREAGEGTPNGPWLDPESRARFWAALE